MKSDDENEAMSEYSDRDMARDIKARREARQAGCNHPQGFRPYANYPDDVVVCATCGLTKPISESPWAPRAAAEPDAP